MVLAWCTVIFFLAALFDLLAGTGGMLTPFLPVAACYVAVTGSGRKVLPVVMIFAAAADGVLMRITHPASMALLPVLIFANYWRENGDCATRHGQAIAGGVATSIYYAAHLMMKATFQIQWQQDLMRVLLLCGFAITAGTIIMPTTCAILDTIGNLMELPLFSDGKRNKGHLENSR